MKKTIIVMAAVAAVTLLAAACTTTGPKPQAEKASEASKTPAGKNIALGKSATSNNHIYEFTADKAFDGDVNTYYEGAAKSYPNDLVVDLGAAKDITGVVIKLNPKRIWSARTQTFEVLVSDDGENFRSAVASAGYDFIPTSNENTVRVDFSAKGRYLKVSFTANTESTGGQAAELEVYGN